MKTISFDEPINISKTHFKSLEDFQLYVVENFQQKDLSETHKEILNERILEANENPENYIALSHLKSSIKRK